MLQMNVLSPISQMWRIPSFGAKEPSFDAKGPGFGPKGPSFRAKGKPFSGNDL